MPDDTTAAAPAVSPTGLPIIPPKAVPYLAAICMFAVLVAEEFPASPVVVHVCHLLAGLGTVIGIISPGARTKGA